MRPYTVLSSLYVPCTRPDRPGLANRHGGAIEADKAARPYITPFNFAAAKRSFA